MIWANIISTISIFVYFVKCNVSFLCKSEYSHELHDVHKDYPLAPKSVQIEENKLRDYWHHLLQGEEFSKPPPKLVPNLCNKTNCIIHYRNLKLFLELELCLTNFHDVLLFDQLPWSKSYSNFNTRQRTAAKNDFEKDFCKLLNNADFGKLFYLYVYFFILCSYVLIHSLIHSLQVKFISLSLFVLLCFYVLRSGVKKKTEETCSSTLLQTIKILIKTWQLWND